MNDGDDDNNNVVREKTAQHSQTDSQRPRERQRNAKRANDQSRYREQLFDNIVIAVGLHLNTQREMIEVGCGSE